MIVLTQITRLEKPGNSGKGDGLCGFLRIAR